MELKKFRKIDNWLGLVIFVIASFVYLSTIEPTTSFWDCGEFIASSYKLEIGHPPGNPVFQMMGRFFTLFASAEKAAVMVNSMSAIFSALTIMFLFWTITHLARRLIEKQLFAGKEGAIKFDEALPSVGSAIAIWGAGAVGALAYTFSDTFWFSAVEAEVYAMSSLFTALVFWAMLKWEEQADQPYANRWIILIAFLMGLSIGVHLLNLLAIPALVFIYYYKKYKPTRKGDVITMGLSLVILAAILYGIIPYIPKVAAYFDLLFVNFFSLPFNSGALFFVVLLLSLSFFAFFWSYKRGKVLLNTALLSFIVIVIGYSAFAMIIIRSVANTPTNENQPDNPFSLIRYLGREQYGSNPLIYGESYASTYQLKESKYWAKVDNRYKKISAPVSQKFDSNTKMLFPRMWSPNADHIEFYKTYTGNRGKSAVGAVDKLPTFKDNLRYFWDYQINHMYFRYFLWNFAGRQNDLHSTTPGDPFKGNWESGIGFLDRARLGDQRVGPDYLTNSRAKNHFYLLPLILGLVGLFYQLKHDKENWWVTMLLFLMTGIAIVLYLNQPPFQPRERDYAYAGSFYAFTIWIGLAVVALWSALKKVLDEKPAAYIVSAVALLVPIQMASQTWDDHDRSNRYTARDIAHNYLNSCDPHAILVTHGDNDTFPLWYMQEVEGVRTDVRVVNTSLLGTDWYIDQMKYKVYNSEPLWFTIPREEYIYGTNDLVQIYDRVEKPVSLKAVIDLISNPQAKMRLTSGEMVSVFAARQLLIPVDKEAVIANGLVPAKDSSLIVDTVKLDLPEGKGILTKSELMILDLLANYKWDRPLYFVAMGGDLGIGIKEYLEYSGFAYKFVPIKTSYQAGKAGRVDSDRLYKKLMEEYRWGNMNDPTVNIDYQNLLTFSAVVSARNIFVQGATALFEEGRVEEAVEVLDRMQYEVPAYNFPLNASLLASLNELSVMSAIDIYLLAGEEEKGLKLASDFVEETFDSIELFATPYRGRYLSRGDLENAISYLLYVAEIYSARGYSEQFDALEERLASLLDQ